MRSRSFPFRCGWVVVVLTSLLLCKSQGQEPKRPRGEKYALLVGVRTYDPNELRSLPYSEDDVTALAAVLRGNGYKPDNVVLMTQTAGAENPRFLPLADRIRKELALLIGDCTEDDSILVAFAGHGVQFRGDLESYFCSADAKLDDKSTLIALGAIYKALEKCPAGFKLLMVDACRNDPRSDNSRARSSFQLESVTRPQQTPPPGGVMAFFSCSEGELAFEHADLKHGVFFHYVIEGLSGNATDVGSDGVTLPELELYVKKRVRDFVRTKYGTRQMPELMGDSRGLVPIVTLDRAMLAYKRAKAFKDRGQIEEARTAYDEALRLNPELARAYLDRGTLRANSGDHIGAVGDFNAAIGRGLNEAWVYVWRGQSYEKTYQYDWAIADYTEAIRLDPKYAIAYNQRGNVHCARRDYDRRDYDRALADYDEAIRLNPKDAFAYNGRGKVYDARRDYDRALADFTEAIRLNPRDAAPYRMRGFIYFTERRDLDRAFADFNEAIRLDPNAADAYFERGGIYYRRRDYDRALADFNEVIRLNPKYGGAIYLARGSLYQKRGDLDRALADFTEAIRLNPNVADAYFERGKVYQAKGDAARANADFSRARQLDPKLGHPSRQVGRPQRRGG